LAESEHKLQAEVLTPEGEVFKGEVEQLSTRTAVGEVGIQANHAPLVGRLVPAELRLHVSDSETIRYAQAEGWLEVYANKAVVLIGEAIPPDELDPSDLKQRLEDAQHRLDEADEDSAAYDQAERDRARAQTFLEVAENR